FLFDCDCYADDQDLHTFPTRRSSDLRSKELKVSRWDRARRRLRGCPFRPTLSTMIASGRQSRLWLRHNPADGDCPGKRLLRWCRSEEHTSELQSQSNLVCRLLLEKKK